MCSSDLIITKLLISGWTQARVCDRFPISLNLIRRLSKQSGAATLRPYGGKNGRRFTETLKKNIRAAAQAGKQPMQIARELNVSCATALYYCRDAGYVKRTYKLKWSEQQILECEQALRRGETWREVARNHGIGCNTLMVRIAFRKKAGR